MMIKAWFDKDDDENTDDQVDATPNMAQSVALQHFIMDLEWRQLTEITTRSSQNQDLTLTTLKNFPSIFRKEFL